MKFSIIIPAYNSAGYIRKALDSVKAQSCKDYELIVVCDSCGDDTEQIAKEYGAVTEAVNFHADGLTRNRGIELARGDWVLFMDDDDWWLHEYVLQQLSDELTDDIDMLCFGFIFKEIGYAAPVRKRNGLHWPACWNKCYKRTAIGDARFSSRRDGPADMQFFLQMMSKGLRIKNFNMPLYYYNYWRPHSISEQFTEDFRGMTELL